METPPDSGKQRWVFVSYSRTDRAFATLVHAVLKAAGIDAWVDTRKIKTGTPNWEKPLREAIKQSQALILLASPNSRRSDYVRDELDLAREHQLTVYPLWVLGDKWIDSVPLGGHTTYRRSRRQVRGRDARVDSSPQ